MLEYLMQFTEKVIISTRAGDIEKDKIINELSSLLENKPKDASKEMGQYIKFLLAVAKGDETEQMWENLPENLQEIFGKVIQKFKGANIFKEMEDLTKKAIISSKSGDDEKVNIINELEAVLSQKPAGASGSVTKYLEFLIELAKGNDVQNLLASQDQKLLDIYNKELEKLYRPDMMEFFIQLTEMAFRAKDSKNAKTSTIMKLKELMSSDPPQEIKSYLTLLLSVTEGNYNKDKNSDIPGELLDLFHNVERKVN